MCDDCKNYEKKEEKIKWEGRVGWAMHGGTAVVYPIGKFEMGSGWETLVGKTTKITIEEI